MADTTIYTPISGRLRRTASAFVAGVRDYRTFVKTKTELEALSDRELADLGISRLDVDRVARESVFGA